MNVFLQNVTSLVTFLCYTANKSGEGVRLRVQERVWGNEYRTVLVCVDDFEDRILSGWICHPCLGEGRKVRGLMEFFKVVEDLLEQIRFPQSFTAKRAFGQAEPVFCREERDSAQGPPTQRETGNVCSADSVSVPCQLAGVCVVAGGRTGRAVPKCIGAGAADRQRIGANRKGRKLREKGTLFSVLRPQD